MFDLIHFGILDCALSRFFLLLLVFSFLDLLLLFGLFAHGLCLINSPFLFLFVLLFFSFSSQHTPFFYFFSYTLNNSHTHPVSALLYTLVLSSTSLDHRHLRKFAHTHAHLSRLLYHKITHTLYHIHTEHQTTTTTKKKRPITRWFFSFLFYFGLFVRLFSCCYLHGIYLFLS